MTQKLYDVDSHLYEFAARIVSCEKTEEGYAVVLDRTAFFPEGDATFLAEFDEGFSFVFFVPFKPKHVDNLAFVVSKIVSHNVIF